MACDDHEQNFKESQLNLTSYVLPPERTDMLTKIDLLLEGVLDPESSDLNDFYTDFFAEWIKYTQSEAHITVKQMHDLPDDFVHCFFLFNV